MWHGRLDRGTSGTPMPTQAKFVQTANILIMSRREDFWPQPKPNFKLQISESGIQESQGTIRMAKIFAK